MPDNNTTIFRVSLANGASKDYTEQDYRDLHIADWLNENHSGKYSVFRLNDAPADSVTRDQQYVVSVIQDGQTKSKVYSGRDFLDLDMGNWLETNHTGNYKIQSVRGYRDANLAADEDYWKEQAERQKESITKFDQDNHEFMFKHEMDKILYDSGEGNITEDAYLADDAKYNELATLKKKLQADYSSNPYVQAIYKTEAQYSDGKAAEYDSIRKNMRGDNPFLGASRQMQSGTEAENDEYMLYGQAKDLARNTAKTFAVETVKAPGENGFVDYLRNYGKAYADVFSDPDFWSRGITEISRNLNLRDIMQKLESKGINLNEVTEKQLDENLTGGEKALLSEFVRNVYAKATRAADMAPGYTAGQVSAESIGFMAEFLATGAIGRALGAGVGAAEEASSAGLRSWIARELRKGSADAIESSVKRSLVNSLTKGGKEALTQGMKNVVSGASRAASGAYSGIVRPVEQAIWHTALQPSTYRQISENLTQIDNNGELISAGNAIWGGVLDQMVENWSETMGGAVETVLGIPFKAAGWAGEKVLGRTSLGQWGKWLADSQAARVLHDAGFNGLIGEMGEEWLGNAARVGLGIMSKDDFKDFASWHDQLEMAASFAPMSLFGLGSSTYAAARQAKEYRQAAEAMRGVLNRAGMTEEEIADVMDVKHTKKEIADALTPVIQRIVHGRQDNTTATEDYITTLKFAQASAMNEVVATAQSIEKEKEREMVRRGIGEELGATSEGDERGRFTHIMKTDRLDADGNPYELEAVTTVKDADGAEWFYMGDNGSQVVLKKRGENGGKPMFLSQEQYAQRVESGEYTETTQLATQFLDEEAEKIRTAEEQARTSREVQDRYAALLNVFSQNPDINLGTEDAPINGRVTGIGRDGIIVDFGQPVLLNGVTRQIHKISLEQAGNAVGIDTAIREDEQRERDSIDQEYLNRQKVSAYNKTYAGKEFTLDGEPYRFVRMFEAPYLDESGTEQVKVTATDARGEDVEVVLPLEELQSQALTPQEQTRSDADQDEAGARVITETTGSLKDFRGNDIPMRINEKTGEEEVDKREFKKRDPEAYYRWNDSRRGGNTSDSMEAIQADIMAKTSEKDTLAAQRQGETDPDMRDELEGQINRLNNEINLLAGIYHKYDAAGNFQNAQRQYAEKFADVERRMLNAKTQEQYDELVTIQRELTKDYFTEMQDAAYTMTLNQRTVELQAALNEIADVPVQVVTMAQIEEVMRGDNASEDAIAKVLDKIADIQRRNMVEGKSYALDGLHYNGKVYIFAEGNRNIDDARVTYYHERQHDINKRNPTAVDAVLVLANNDHDALFQTLTAIIGDAGTYRKSDERTLADEIVAFTMEKAWTNPEYVEELRALGLSDELINIISSEYGRQQGTSEDLDSGSGDRTARNSDSGQADYRIDEQARGGESGDEQLGSAQPGVEAEEPIGSITPETAAELADKGLVMDGGVVMSADLSTLKQAVGYLTPNEKSPEQEIVEYSVRTRKAWADNYRKYPDSEERVIRALENLAERMTADELVSGVISQGNYKYGKKDKGSFAGPLRTNIEYVVTFDMDTTCPRTFQYLNYVKQIENRIGRPLTQTECIQLTEMMRMYGQQIPCVYCYSENKRQALKQYYTDFMTARHAVLNAATDEEALEYMYGHGTSKAARESKDPAVALNEAAYKVFLQWRSERRTAYNPSLKMLWFQYSNDRNVVLNVLDQLYADGRIMTDLNDDIIAAVVDTELRINDPAAVKVVEDIVSEWKWDAIEGREHSDFTPVEEDDLVVDPRTLSLWREMTSYAKSASQAKSVLRYIPYTDELKKLSQEQKDYINGMGGVRMHSSNDFRIDYVFDYFQFMADMAANKMFGHTYTKSPEFVRIFGNSGYKINMSIAAYEDENGNIRMNEDEGFNWDVAKELRNAFPNAGVMLMATSDNQIQMALDSDWIDMFIPFHASSLPKAVWYNMRAWKDYTTVQNEAFLNGDEMRAALISDGVELPKNIKAADVERMYLEHFNIKTIIGTAGKQKGKRLRPHFLPGPTVVDGQYVPGHDNDTGRYLQLCREYGVHPRFYGIKVKNAEGKTIDITEHPNYIKCIKETARTDSPQTAVRFNFDQPSEALGGKTPIEYAFDELQTRAAAEMQAAGSPVRDIYKSLEKDAFGIVPQFIDTIIKHKEKTGKDYPIDYITPDSRKWFLTERKALEEAYKDIETIPYHRNEYDIEGEPVKTRVTEKSNDAQKIEQQKALDFISGTRSFAEEGGDIRYSIRTKPAPKSTGIGYKVFYLKDGKLYPPMVANPGGADTPVGVWLDADAAPQAAASKTGRKKVKAGGKGTQGGSGTLAYRPGWHLGEIPYALQFNRGPKVDNPLGITGKNGKAIKVGKYFPANFVWAEVEYAKDVDYQDEAMSYGYNGAGNFQHSLAGLPKIPVDGSYTYRTNANPATDPWIITGAMKVNRVLTDSEVDELVRQAGREPQLREGKTEESRDVRENNEPSFRVVNDNQQVFVSNALASLDKIPMKSGNAQAWINKIQQAGGLKKEEDKWMGLTDWLNEQKGNISKEDVAEFIREHQVQIEEVKYGTTPINNDYSGAIAGEKGVEFRDRFLDAFNVYLEEGDEDMGIPDRFRSELVNDEEAMDLYNENHEDKVSLDEEGYLDNVAQDKVMTWGDEILDAVTGTGEKPINSTRMSYTTDGLENNREIALVVPTIKPYKESDDVHFGDAGEGRAVAWSRFGDAVDKDGNKVLVIDEIQSKRHQDAKENGYSEKDIPSKMDAYSAKEKAFEDYDRVFAELSGKYSEEDVREMLMSEEDNASYRDVLEKRKEANRIYNLAISRVPDAPFRDSWDALAMKRMLRLAAEEGYDKIAWTNGQMQSDRYDLTKVLDDFYYKPNGDGTYKVSAALNQRRTGYTEYSDLNYDSLTVDRIGEIFGKEIAAKVSEGKGRKGYSHNDERDWITFSGRDLKMANEGMRYFYDQKLVNWMNKYGKKWGVQVADLILPGLENEDGWHSVDVTAEMKESVMEGQPLFRTTEQREQLFADAKNEFGTTRDFREAGYLLPDGSMLDFSEKNNGGEPGRRGADHRDIARVINDRSYGTMTEYLDDFINEGAIRLIPESGAFSVAKQPTKEQKNMLRNFIYRYNGEVEVEIYKNGHSVADPYYRERTSPTRILNDIDAYFKDGTIPEGNAPMFRAVEITPETRDEMEQIKAIARLNGTYLKAPNGADTKLTPEQWAMVRTKAFKAWFGDWENDPENASKVVDENGEPMVMYHGTGREFYTFGNTDSANELGAGFYFTDNRRLAEAYTNPKLSDNEGKIEARAMEIFIDDMGHSEEDSYDNEFVHDYNEAYDMAETELFGKPRVMSGFLNVRNPRMVVDNSNLEEEQGEHDGVIDNTFGKRHGGLMIQSRAGESAMQVMVYNPNQIKSATDNTGSFEPTDPDIRYRVTPEQDEEYMAAVEAGDMEKAQQMVKDAFKAAFPNTKVVDENGEPMVVYHGTNKQVNEFNIDSNKVNNTVGDPDGFYFTNDFGQAGNYSRASVKKTGEGKFNVQAAFLNLRNPVDATEAWRKNKKKSLDKRKTYSEVKRSVYNTFDADVNDGYMITSNNNAWEYVAISPNQVKSADPVTYDDEGNIIPLSQRFTPESSDIRFRTLDKTEVFKKIRNSKEAIISGDEIEFTPGDDKGNKKKALDYGKRLQGTYINADTGLSIQLQRGRHNGGLNEVLKHDYKNEEHIKSIAAIPQLIENGILIAEVPNEDKPKNPTVSSYQHYVCGLKIGDSEYTVHALIAVDAKGDRYYDHNLISIEKENLLNLLSQAENNNGFGTTPDTKSTTVTGHKFNKLISILQSLTDVKARITPAQDAEYRKAYESGDTEKAMQMVKDAFNAAYPNNKIVDENGEPMVVYRGQNWDKQDGKMTSGLFVSLDEDFAEGYGDVKPLFVRSVNPFNGEKDAESLRQFVEENFDELQAEYEAFFDEEEGYEDVDSLMDALNENWWIAYEYSDILRNEIIRRGYDSIFIREDADNIWLTSPGQIKSAEPFTFDDNGNLIPLSERFNTESDDIRFRISPEQDQEFRKSYEDGDVAKAIEMLDAAAIAAGYDTKAFHGTEKGFNVFQADYRTGGNFFTPQEDAAKAYADAQSSGNGGVVIPVYLNLGKTFEIDAKGSQWDEVPVEWEVDSREDDYDEFFDSYGDAEREALKHPDAVISSSGISDTNDIAKRAKNDGYDSVIIRNVYDPGDSSFDSMQDDIVIFTPSRIKSAEPFTFDDNGDLIPLSQRFNPESDDIRFRSAEHGFYNGMSNDDFFDKVSEMSDFGSGGASRLISALEEHYGGELESLSNGARMAINDGRLPFPGPKFSGADGEYHHIAFIKDGERVTEAVPFDTMENVRSHGISLRVTSRQDDGYSRPDGLSDAEMADRKRNAMSGLQDFDREAVADMLMKIFEEVPEEIRAVITDNAASTGYNFGKAAVNYFAALAERDELNDGERNAIAIMRDNLKEMLGIDNLSLDDALWSLYRTSTAGERDLLTAARKAIVADRLGHSPADEARRREIDDELRFSIRREMESMSAADMYNKATSYYMNRLKESFVDMNESVNDLVTAIEKATGMKAEAFEDIRLALNQQSSKGLAAMSKYTSDYLEPLWAQIDTVMKATGMSYDDVVRYVMLKHAVERNDVFAKRDAKSFYRAEFDKVVDPLLADRKKLEKDRKKALADGDITTADECDGKIQAIDVQVAAEQKKLDRHNVMVDNGTAAKYKEFREQDYGGLTSMYSEYPGLLPRDRYKTDEEYNQAARKVRKPIYQTVAEMEVAALGEVDAFERRASGDEFDKLWEKINAATKATLESQYKSNVISKDQYMAVRDEFKYYVPLRGFKDTTAEDIWSYYNTSHSGDFSPALLGAKGRRTEAENPFNWIGTMASSAIAQNMKNESKLALYYFIANRPDQDLMSIKDVWYQFDPTATAEYQQKNPGSKKRVFREVHPPFNESLNADSAKNAYDLWEENMRQQAKNGLAFRGSNSLKVGDDVVFIGAGEAAQHIISLKLRGKEVSLILNANPRAAQAINGLLNIETEGGYQKIFGPVLRWMSAVNTSYNPEFWISNMQRDILFALMGTSIKGGSTSKFLGNLVNPKKIMRMMKAYEEGTLGNSEVENYYREFAESGAITGFTVVSGNEVWEKKIAEFLDPSIWDKIQNSGFMMFWQNLGEAVEQMTRFSAYMSARKSGKDIVEATNAAKEISVNFNRKGSGKHISVEELDKLTRKDGSRLNKTQKAGVYLMSLIPAYGRRAVMFFNAAIQGLNAMYKLWKKNPKRSVGWMTGYFALGVIQAVIHALFDDDDDYLDMPDYTRRNNLLIGYNGIYLKWAMPQEARAFYAFGDMAVNHIMGREPNKNLALEMGNAIADMLPLSATDGVTGLLPSAAQPLVELYTNKDFTGARIYNDMRYLSEDERSKTPKYANALPQTGKIFVNVTEFLNYITGGSEWDAGYINVHPEAIQHVVEGAGGGLLTTINKAWETVGGAIDAAAGLDVTGEKLSVRRFPFLNRLLEVNDERSRNSHVSELFYYYKSEAEHTRTKMSKMKKAGDSDGLSELVESREYEIYTIYKSYEKLMKRYDEQIKIEEDMDEKKALMREQDEYRKEMIYEISKLE